MIPSAVPAPARHAGTPAVLLAFDTSTDLLAAALSGPWGTLTASRPGGAAASATLLPVLEQLLRQAGVTWAALQAVAFGAGPGAFTGLRTSCAVAQGLALGLNVPVLPLDSLMLVAEDARQASGREGEFVIVMDARMNEAYVARYRWTPDAQWQCLHAPALYTLHALAAQLGDWGSGAADGVGGAGGSDHADAAPAVTLAGNGLLAFDDRLPWPKGALKWPQEQDRGRALAALAQAAWQRGEGLDAAAALPIYLRDKVALTTAEREAAKRAASVAAL